MWLQHLKVGLWLMGNNDNLIVENSRFLDMTADGLSLNGNARGVKVRNNFLRNQGDDALAMWSLYAPDTTLVAPRDYRFDPASGNTVTVTLPGTGVRYVRLHVTGNTGWPAAQFSEVEAYLTS